MKFTKQLWRETEEIFLKIINLPFIQELMQGTLVRDKFIFYIQQDSLYLLDYSKVLAIIAAKSEKTEMVLQFLQFAESAIVVEKAMHENYFEKYSIKPDFKKSPVCFTYTNFLISIALMKSIEEAMAAILPCFWIFFKVGTYMYKNAASNNPYQYLINAYVGNEFKNATEKAIKITDEISEEVNEKTREKMKEAFTYSTKLEYMFWDSAYKLEQWIV